MQPCLKVVVSSSVEHDYSAVVDGEEGLQIERNDLDAEGAGRSLLDGLMYRSRIAQKYKITVKFLPLLASQVAQISQDFKLAFVNIKIVDPDTDTVVTKTVYSSTLVYGTPRYNHDRQTSVYEGCTISLIER